MVDCSDQITATQLVVLTIFIASEFGASVIKVVDSAEDTDGTGRGGWDLIGGDLCLTGQ